MTGVILTKQSVLFSSPVSCLILKLQVRYSTLAFTLSLFVWVLLLCSVCVCVQGVALMACSVRKCVLLFVVSWLYYILYYTYMRLCLDVCEGLVQGLENLNL